MTTYQLLNRFLRRNKSIRVLVLILLSIGLFSSIVTNQRQPHAISGNKRVKVPFLGPANGDQWWERYVDYAARTFHSPLSRSGISSYDWCIPTLESQNNEEGKKQRITHLTSNEENLKGILFVKNYKAASSTGSGITARMAHTVGKRKFASHQKENNNNDNNNDNDNDNDNDKVSTICTYRADHEFADSLDHTHARDYSHSFLWTVVRHPESRIISGFSYFRPQQQSENNDMLFAYAKSERSAQTAFLDTTSPSKERLSWTKGSSGSVRTNLAVSTIRHSIFNMYNFIAVQERMEESLVVLKLLLGLDYWDVLVLSAKRSGQYVLDPRGRCTLINSTNVSAQVKQFFTNDFPQYNYDYLLYHAANQSLDKTIQSLGFTKVQEERMEFRKFQLLAEKYCQDEAYFPCSVDGKKQLAASRGSCYYQDWACGYKCLDRLQQDWEDGRIKLPSD